MKANKLLLALVTFLFSLEGNSQNNVQSATLTSGGLEAGVTTMGLGLNTFYGYQAGKVNTGIDNLFIGNQSGKANTNGNSNTYLGSKSGLIFTSGYQNTFIGERSGNAITSGYENTFVGAGSGGGSNSITNSGFGAWAGSISTGEFNTFLGPYSGYSSHGNNNLFVGGGVGDHCTGNGNIFLGFTTGSNQTVSNRLLIDNEDNASPLIWGDFALNQVKLNGKVGIGNVATFPTIGGNVNVANYNLFVSGGILTEEVRVALQTGWADYVFEKDYNLKPLSEVEKYITENGHLPNVPSAKQVKNEGIELGDMARIQQEKIEELTLYLIQQNKEIEELKAQMKALLAKQN
ncbi:MAG TPA: hypothetical protein VF581_02430 [Flavobacterium sp.]|jgi:hypothetical protein